MPKKRFDFSPITQPVAPVRDHVLTASPDGSRELHKARLVAIGRIVADPDQPRKSFPDVSLRELADSLRAQGMRQPITVYYDDSREHFVVISGERRLRAAAMAGLTDLPVLVEHRPGSESDKLVLQLAENLVREDLTPLEAAAALERLKELRPRDWEEVAAQHGFKRRRAYQVMQLLNDPPPLREAVAQGAISEGHAAELRRMPQEQIPRLIEEVSANDLSVADTRRLLAGQRSDRSGGTREMEATSPEIPSPPETPIAAPHVAGDNGIGYGLMAGTVAETIAGVTPGKQPGLPVPSEGAALREAKNRRAYAHRLRQRLERIASELRNIHMEEVSAELASLPEILLQARQARDSLQEFIDLLERVRLDQAGRMERPPQ